MQISKKKIVKPRSHFYNYTYSDSTTTFNSTPKQPLNSIHLAYFD